MKILFKNQLRGFAILISVLVLAVVGMAISTTLLMMSVSSAQTTLIVQDALQAQELAHTCAELGLQALVTTPTFTGSSASTTLTGQSGSCIYSVVAIDATHSTINSTGAIRQVSQKVQIQMLIPQLTILSWQEVGSF